MCKCKIFFVVAYGDDLKNGALSDNVFIEMLES